MFAGLIVDSFVHLIGQLRHEASCGALYYALDLYFAIFNIHAFIEANWYNVVYEGLYILYIHRQ